MYKVDFSLNEWNFTVYFNNREDYLYYKEVISNSVYEMSHKNNGELIKIYYLKDKKLYVEKLDETKKKKREVISSFQDEYYDKYGMTFISSENRYLINRIDKNTFSLLCKDSLKRPELIYLIREIYVRLEENNKSLFIHGNGIKIDNKGVIIMGGSGSGKTTFMLKLFESDEKSLEYLSNDRIFLTQNDNIEYFPIPLILASGTAKNIRPIFTYLKNKQSLYDSSFKNNMLYSEKNNIKFELFKKYIPEIFPNCKLVEKSNIDVIIMPKMNFDIDDISVRQVCDYAETMPMCFTPTDSESQRKPWIMERDNSDEILKKQSIKKLKEKTNQGIVYKVNYNPNMDSIILRHKISEKVLERIP